ncbi:MAG: UbiA prenyltransferase family protein [Oligoflexia bacterium]|nr:UbiA prenyltransferase family protein [Oligoflexia bacterium]MBF0366209.1 UbiA prenyltransferase family protein [Oligoflexia bacterium]
MKVYLHLCRPQQWIKNFIVFGPLLFGGHLHHSESIAITALVFLCFSLLGSSVYILNDICDRDLDRLHPQKASRPLASGAVTIASAAALALLLMLTSLALTLLLQLQGQMLSLLSFLLFYLVVNLLYSLKLKHYAIIDISLIALGFVIRVLAASFAIDVEPSRWLIIMTFLLALFIALSKRRSDAIILAQSEVPLRLRPSMDGYSIDFINTSMNMMAGVTILAYILYTVSESVTSRSGGEYFYLSSLWVVIGFLRYLQLTIVYNRSGSPTKLFLKDLPLQLVVLAWIATFIWILR